MTVCGRVVFCLLFANVYNKQCYWNATQNYGYFGTVTPYDSVRGDIRDEDAPEGCTPVSVWALVRHGTRYPGQVAKSMRNATALKDQIINNHYRGRGEMCAQDIINLANRTWDDSFNTPGLLTEQGNLEMLHLGQRIRDKFSSLLGELDTFQFRPTRSQRTEKSAEAFVEGLGDPKFKIEKALEIDNVIMPYLHCDNHLLYYKNVMEMKEEVKRFYETKLFQKMLSNTRHKVGIPELTVANVTIMYNMCRFFRAFSADKTDPWCAVFNNEDLPVLEYVNDLERYYSTSFASPFASSLGALSLKNLYENLEASVNGSRRFTGYFTHDTTVTMVFTALGLFRDYPGISGYKMTPERKFKTSLITPFASNLIVVLNKCSSSNIESHRVQVFINEVVVPLCRARSCAWAEFREKLQPFLNSNLDICTAKRYTRMK